MELLVKSDFITVYIYIYGLNLATLKAVSFYLLNNVSTLKQRRKFSCVTPCIPCAMDCLTRWPGNFALKCSAFTSERT
jgi:hypothetical protein